MAFGDQQLFVVNNVQLKKKFKIKYLLITLINKLLLNNFFEY